MGASPATAVLSLGEEGKESIVRFPDVELVGREDERPAAAKGEGSIEYLLGWSKDRAVKGEQSVGGENVRRLATEETRCHCQLRREDKAGAKGRRSVGTC